MEEIILGIDIGGTNTVFGLVDKNGHCLVKSSLPTTDFKKATLLVEAICQYVKEVLSDLGKVHLLGIGIGAPNGNFYRGTIEHAPNLSWEGIIPVADLFKKHFNLPVLVTNDANAVAIGEMIYGAAQGVDDFIVVTLGTGLGSGIVSNGQLIYGHDGFAGELGHVIIEANGRNCGCGRKGCLETYVSASGLVKTAQLLLENKSKVSLLRQFKPSELSAKDIAQAAEKNDDLALAVFDFTAQKFGFALANVVTITSPELIVLYGGLVKSGNLLLIPTQKYLESNLLNIYQGKVKLIMSSLVGDHAAILGAAALVLQQLKFQ